MWDTTCRQSPWWCFAAFARCTLSWNLGFSSTQTWPVVHFLIVCTSVLLKIKCKLERTLLIQSLIFIQNTMLLLLSHFLVHHILNFLPSNEICWHTSSSVVRAHIPFQHFSLPLASPQSECIPMLSVAVVFLLSSQPPLPWDMGSFLLLHSQNKTKLHSLLHHCQANGCYHICWARVAMWISSKQCVRGEWVSELNMLGEEKEEMEEGVSERPSLWSGLGACALALLLSPHHTWKETGSKHPGLTSSHTWSHSWQVFLVSPV